MKQYKIVGDSSSNLTEEMAQALFPPSVLFGTASLKLRSGTKEYVDDKDLDVEGMVKEMRAAKAPTSSSCPNVSDYLDCYEGANRIFVFTISGNLSGSYAAACAAAQEYCEAHPDVKIHVFNTFSTGPEMQLMMEKTAELTLKELPFSEIVERVEEYRKGTHLIFSLESLRNLAANGRVSPAVAAIAGVLGIRVLAMASEQGTIESLKKTRGEKAMLRTLWEIMQELGYSGGKVRLAHCLNENAAKSLVELIRARFADADTEIRACRGLCSVYAEIGGLLIGFETAKA